MKKQIFILILAIITFLAIFIACQEDEFFLPHKVYEYRNPENLLPEVKDALQWYKENSHQISIPRTKGGRHPLFDEMEPDWRHAAPRTGEGYTTVETSLKTLTATRFIDPECGQSFTTDNNSIRKTLTRLVIHTDLQNEETLGFFMTIIPNPTYLQQKDYCWPMYNRYGSMDEQFSGTIIFHDLDGTRANGWILKNGKATHTIPRSDEPTAIATRGYIPVEHCVEVYEEICTSWHVVTEVNGEIENEYVTPEECNQIYLGSQCWTSYEYVPDPTPGGGSSGGGGGGGDFTYQPPKCNKCNHYPCVCIKEEECDEANSAILENVYEQFKKAGVEEKFIQQYKDASVEWCSILYDSSGTLCMSSPKTDNKTNIVKLPRIPKSTTLLASIHNHPSKNGPSTKDALTLASLATTGKCKIMYVCTSDNRVFALIVTNPIAAKRFYEQYQDTIGRNGLSSLYKDYWRKLYSYDTIKEIYDYHISSPYALSTLLNTFNSGIQVMADTIINNKRTFKLYKGQQVNINGTRIIKRTKCK